MVGFWGAGPVAGASTQNPTTQIVSASSLLFDTTVSYPAFSGSLRAFDESAGGALLWDAATVAANGTPGWTHRLIYFSDQSGNVVKVQIASDGTITNAAAPMPPAWAPTPPRQAPSYHGSSASNGPSASKGPSACRQRSRMCRGWAAPIP